MAATSDRHVPRLVFQSASVLIADFSLLAEGELAVAGAAQDCQFGSLFSRQIVHHSVLASWSETARSWPPLL